MAKDNDAFGDLGELGSLDDQFQKLGLDKLSKDPQKPTDAAQLLAGKVTPIGRPEDKMHDVSLIGEEGGVSYFRDSTPKGYVAPPKEETYVDVVKELSEAFNANNAHVEQQVKVVELQQVMNRRLLAQSANDEIVPEMAMEKPAKNDQMEAALHHQNPLNQRTQHVMSKDEVLAILEEKGHENLGRQYRYLAEHLETVKVEPGVDKLARLNEIALKQPHDISNTQLAMNLNQAGVQVTEQVAMAQRDSNSGALYVN